MPYLPQAASIFVTRNLGFGADVMLVVARFVVLAMYVALVGIAIARSPRSKWALCAAGLLPVAVFQSRVVDLARRLHDRGSRCWSCRRPCGRSIHPRARRRAHSLIEAFVLSAVLGSVKPAYVVMAGLYLLPLLGARRRTDRWPLVFAPVLGAIVSLLWTAAAGNVWKTDAGYFGINVDEAAQKHELLHQPWEFGADLARTVVDQLWYWVHTLVSVGPSVTAGPAILAVLGLAVYGVTVVAARSQRGADPARLVAARAGPDRVLHRMPARRDAELHLLDRTGLE